MMRVSTSDPRFDAPSAGECGGRSALPTGPENAHVPCIGVTLPWLAKRQNKKTNKNPGRGQDEVQMGKDTNMGILFARRSSIGIFFSQAHRVLVEVEPPARRELGQVNHQR